MTIRWGVVATGGIANRFAGAMTRVDDGEIVAVSSRTSEGAAAFADRWDIERGYSNEDEMAADPDIDVVYVATPHSRHETDTIRYLESGKPVLCEKPFALNSTQVKQMIATATSHGLFLMEAVWSRFLPAYRALTELVAAGHIGTPLQVDAELGFPVPFDANHRLFAPELGGGALLDLGIYPLQLCTLILGPIGRVAAVASIGETGVDEQVAAVLHHERGGLGVAKASVSAVLSCTARISGSEGRIDIPTFMHCPRSLTVHSRGVAEVIDCAFDGDGLEFQIAEVHRCIEAGLTESPLMPLSETLALAVAMDEVRAQIGVRYPSEP